jgi:hypothetical protein
MSGRYAPVQDGEWVKPRTRDYKIKCCDCGLVHKMQFKVAGGRVVFRAWRDPRATAVARRGKKWKSSDFEG